MSSPVASPEAPAENPPEEATKTNLASLLARGSVWALVGYAAAQVMRLGSNLILWRMLQPDMFGLMAIVSTVMMGLAMFSDIGIGPSIIQHERGDEPRYLNTAWTIQVARGFALFACAVVFAHPIASFYGEPNLASLVIAVALGLVINGFNSTRLFTAARHISLGRLTLIDLGTQLFSLIVMVIIASITHDVWSLVLGGLGANVLRLVLSHTVLPGIKNRLTWDRDCARVLVSFGRWVFLSTLLTFAVMQSDRLIFGKLITIEQLGIYNVANVWAAIPLSVVGRVFEVALFPALARVKHVNEEFQRSYADMRRPWLLLGGGMCACLVAGGPALIRFFYDQRAADAEWILQVLGASMWFYVLEAANGTALIARGYPKYVAAGNFAKLIGMLVLIPLGMHTYGFPGAVVGYAASELFRYVVSVTTLAYVGARALRDDFTLTLLVVVTAGLGLMLAPWLRGELAPLAGRLPRVASFIEATVVGLVVASGWGMAFLRHRASQRVPQAAVAA